MVLLIMMYDLEKASKSAPGISLYVSDDPQGSNEVLGPAALASLIRMARWYMNCHFRMILKIILK